MKGFALLESFGAMDLQKNTPRSQRRRVSVDDRETQHSTRRGNLLPARGVRRTRSGKKREARAKNSRFGPVSKGLAWLSLSSVSFVLGKNWLALDVPLLGTTEAC